MTRIGTIAILAVIEAAYLLSAVALVILASIVW